MEQDIKKEQNNKYTEESKKDRFIRWQEKSHKLFSFTINMLFTLNIFTLGVLLNNDSTFKLIINANSLKILIYIVSFSSLFGLGTILSRLIDFNKTTKITKLKYQEPKSPEIDKLRKKTYCLGKLTWILFYGQVFLIVLAILTLLFLIVSSNRI